MRIARHNIGHDRLPDPTATSNSWGITVGPNGNIWFTGAATSGEPNAGARANIGRAGQPILRPRTYRL